METRFIASAFIAFAFGNAVASAVFGVNGVALATEVGVANESVSLVNFCHAQHGDQRA